MILDDRCALFAPLAPGADIGLGRECYQRHMSALRRMIECNQ